MPISLALPSFYLMVNKVQYLSLMISRVFDIFSFDHDIFDISKLKPLKNL